MKKQMKKKKLNGIKADVKRSAFAENDYAIVFNGREWQKIGDLPEGNGKYYQRAKVIEVYKSKYGEWLADVIFDNGEYSRGHFQSGMKHCA